MRARSAISSLFFGSSIACGLCIAMLAAQAQYSAIATVALTSGAGYLIAAAMYRLPSLADWLSPRGYRKRPVNRVDDAPFKVALLPDGHLRVPELRTLGFRSASIAGALWLRRRAPRSA